MRSRLGAAVRVAGAVTLGVAVIAAAARICIRLPISPVPVTMQTLAVLVVGGLYGSRLGAATVVSYLLLGMAGAPVFAGGVAGPAVFVGPTAGYLLGFVFAAYLVGRLQELGGGKLLPCAAGVLAATVAILLCGTAWLSVYLGGDIQRALLAGFVPFIPGDLAKAAFALAVCGSLRGPVARLLHPHNGDQDANL